MILFPLLLCLVVPVWMWYLGRTYRNGNVPYRKSKGIRYRSKRAAASEEAWVFANDLYFNMLRMCGINMVLIAFVLFIPVMIRAAGLVWLLCAILIPFQLVGGFLLTGLFTEMMTRRFYDADGIFLHDQSEEEEAAGGEGFPE